MTPKYFVEQIKRLVTRITNLEARVPAGKIKVKFNPTDTIAAGAWEDVSVTVPGLVAGDAIVVSYPSDQGDAVVAVAGFQEAGQAIVWMHNPAPSGSYTVSGDWYVHVIK